MDLFIVEKSDIKHINQDLLSKFSHKNFNNIEKQKEHCFAYLMLDRILREVYSITDAEVCFINNKPYLKNKQKYFSISHSGDYLVIAFSDCECGIDIEQIKERNYKKIANRMSFECSTMEEFYYCWTKYEAEYKLKLNPAKYKQYKYNNYVITAASVNSQESFDIYIQNGETFSNSQN